MGLLAATSSDLFPADLRSFCVLALEVDRLSGLNDNDTVQTAPCFIGGPFSQATAGARPTYKTDQCNGKPALRFAAGKFMQAATGAQTGDFWVVSVFRRTATSPTYQFVGGFGEEATGKRRLLTLNSIQGRITFNGFNADLTNEIRLQTDTLKFVVGEMQKSGTTVSVRRSGEVPLTGVPGLNSFTSTTVTLGGNNAGAENLEGEVAAFYVFTRPPNEVERMLFGAYLRTRYAVAYSVGQTIGSSSNTNSGHLFVSNAASDDTGVIAHNVAANGVSHFVAVRNDKSVPGAGRGMAVGIGNSGVAAPFTNAVYLEAYELDTVSAPPRNMRVQTGVIGTNAIRVRDEFAANGDYILYDTAGNAVLKVLANGTIKILRTTAAADGDLAANELSIWFDPTDGASRVKFKGKSANGTVVTGEVVLL